MAVPTNIFDAYMGRYDPQNDMTASQQLAAYMRMNQHQNAQNLSDALGLQHAYQKPNPVNPEPNPVLLLLE